MRMSELMKMYCFDGNALRAEMSIHFSTGIPYELRFGTGSVNSPRFFT